LILHHLLELPSLKSYKEVLLSNKSSSNELNHSLKLQFNTYLLGFFKATQFPYPIENWVQMSFKQLDTSISSQISSRFKEIEISPTVLQQTEFTVWSQRSNAFLESIKLTQQSRIKEWIKNVVGTNRRNEAKWSRIFTELTNERGPWGYGNGDKNDIFWMLDSYENNLHQKIRLCRNPHGNRHTLATQKSNGKFFNQFNLMTHNKDEDKTMYEAKIFKDLKKYKKVQTINAIENNDYGNYSDVEDEENSINSFSSTELLETALSVILFYSFFFVLIMFYSG
jgi:hypothetical protein